MVEYSGFKGPAYSNVVTTLGGSLTALEPINFA